MMNMHGNTKVFVYVLSVLTILALTFSGFGGTGRESLTAFAETSSLGPEDRAGLEREASRKTNEDQEFQESVRQGRLVVGYMIEKDARDQKEAPKTGDNPAGEESSKAEESSRAENSSKAENSSYQANEDNPGIEEREKDKEGKREKPGTPISGEDYQVLLRIVEAEAGVCDSKGKILVANVVLNRVRSQEFPDTVREVVYQPSQFSPVSNGSINTCEVTSQTVECVDRALAGEDYSQGALYFMNRGASRSGAVRWFDGRLTFLFSHQSHEFFK